MSLSEIQIRLGEDMLETLMVSVDFTTVTKKVMSPSLKCIDYGCKL